MKSKKLEALVRYKSYKSNYQRTIEEGKVSYYNNLFQENRSNPKKLWKLGGEITGRMQCKEPLSSQFRNDNVILTDTNKIDNGFNTYITSIGKSLANGYP